MDVVGVVDIEARLERLTSQGLLDHVSAAPEPEYEFRHALIHDAAYASLRRQDRRRLHLRVADALERVHPERADLAGTLAHHLMRAGSPTRALPHLISAGDQAAAIFANREAAGHYQSALDLVAAGAVGQETERARLDAMLHEKLGDLWEALGDHTAAIASFEAAGSGPGDGDPIRRARLWRKVGVSRLGARELPETGCPGSGRDADGPLARTARSGLVDGVGAAPAGPCVDPLLRRAHGTAGGSPGGNP